VSSRQAGQRQDDEAWLQGILNRDIPTVSLPEDAGSVRVIAGEYANHAGPAQTSPR
jgi:redox-sensitive bicupin YhaK (pirin superfamily)